MKIAALICRILLGLGFTVFGANILHPFLPMPPMPPESLPGKFMAVMWPTHWMQMVGAFQLIGGLCVLSGRLTPIGLVLLGPVLVNILAFHIFLTGGEGLMNGLVFLALEVFLIYAYRSHFAPIFTMNAKPTTAGKM
jgi:putative oxidoreductase